MAISFLGILIDTQKKELHQVARRKALSPERANFDRERSEELPKMRSPSPDWPATACLPSGTGGSTFLRRMFPWW